MWKGKVDTAGEGRRSASTLRVPEPATDEALGAVCECQPSDIPPVVVHAKRVQATWTLKRPEEWAAIF
jgi:acyl-CoA reductase-like NAD-dependent aldehyde dehydrogenase